MNGFITAVTQGMIAFAATNIDDIIILLIFFSQIDRNFRTRHIFIGQYLGFAAIIILSLPGFFGGLVVHREWIGLLGIIPIAMGIKQLVNRPEESTEVQTVNTEQFHPQSSFLLSILHPNTYKVAAVTFANGGDNISIYIPLFAGQNIVGLGIILAVFFVMVGVWCCIAYLLNRQAHISYILSRYGQAIVPFVLIGLGLFIMYERGTFNLLFGKIN